MARAPDLMAKVALLRSAEDIFSAHGLEAAKVDEIAKKAGVSKGAFYLHFESKEQAFKEVVESFLARFSSMLVSPADHSQLPSTPRAMLDFVVQQDTGIFDFLWQNKDIVGIVDGCHGHFAYLLEGFNKTMIDASRVWIDHWKKAGLVRKDADSLVAAVLINGAYQALARLMVAQKKRPPIEIWVEESVAFFFAGLSTPALAESIHRRKRSAKVTRGSRTNNH